LNSFYLLFVVSIILTRSTVALFPS